MKKNLIILAVIMMMVVVSLNSTVNVYLTNMVNGAPQDTITVLTNAEDQVFITFTVENGETEPIILQCVNFSCWNLNLPAPEPNIQFYMVTNDGQWNPSNNSIMDLKFQNIGTIIQPNTSKTFVVMGNIWDNSNGGAKFSLGLCSSENFQITGQNSGETHFANMIGPYQDNIFHIINKWEPMHRLSMAPLVNPVEIHQNYYQDHFWVYPGQSFWSYLSVNSLPNSLPNSIVTMDSRTIFGGAPGLINPGDGNFFVTDYLPGLAYAWHPEYSTFQMSWTSPNVIGVNDVFLYETLIKTNLTYLDPDQIQSEYTSIETGNFNPLFGMITKCAQYERVYHPYQAIKLDVSGDGIFSQDDLDMCQQYNVGNINLYGTNFNNNSAPNISRSSVLFFYPNMFDQWLGNVYLNHPDEPIVQGLGIGQPYDGTWPNITEVTFNQTGNTITVNTSGNCIGVFGKLPNGEDWNTVIFMNGAENLCWSSDRRHSIEPEKIQMNRSGEGIQIQIPEGLSHIDVQARSLAQYVDNDDSITPAITPTLGNAYPNPFKTQTSVSYNLPKSGNVEIGVYNIKGQLIKTLINETKSSGEHNISWNGIDQNGHSVATGIYFFKMVSGKYSAIKKVMLVK
ncbi:MAG TPA: FlgD immunoglobulin-like domain containing protein [bacterium]|nr:FlgD immunoglobulin-like domain containing protein [bacterium]HOG38005.1 FlgD immunoglobulin-like domain containing protein [bacterium]